MSDNMIQIGDYNVRLVTKGDRYGLNDCLAHEEDKPMVEFYSTKVQKTGRGYFVSRYYCGTLQNKPGFYGHDHTNAGLCLHGDRYNYHSISAEEFQAVLRFIAKNEKEWDRARRDPCW